MGENIPPSFTPFITETDQINCYSTLLSMIGEYTQI